MTTLHPPVERRKLIYHGRVHGVGFRATVADLATDFAVSGFVRNESDGTVELQVQGAPKEVEQLIAAIAERFARHISAVEMQPAAPAADESGFDVRF